jgi:hypothetical protein
MRMGWPRPREIYGVFKKSLSYVAKGKSSRSVKLTTHRHLEIKLKKELCQGGPKVPDYICAITCYCYWTWLLTSLPQTREKRNWNLFIPRSFIHLFVFVRTIVSGANCQGVVIANGECYMSLECESLLRHWVAMLWRLPGTCGRRVQLKFYTCSLRIREEQVMLVHEETYIPTRITLVISTHGHATAFTHELFL